MKIIKPRLQFWYQHNTVDHIAKCARVCYASDKIAHNDKMCDALWKNNHRSMFRHAGVYYIIPLKIYDNNPIPKKAYIDAVVRIVNKKVHVSVNEQSAREYWDNLFHEYRITFDEAEQNAIFYGHKMIRYSLCIETGIDITRELNRTSPNNIAEQSTRYVDFTKKLGICYKECHWMPKCNWYRRLLYKLMAKINEWSYKLSRSKYGLNLPPEDARWILALDVMSKVVYTYTVADWERIINLRYFEYTGKAHKDAKIIGKMIYHTLISLGYDITNYKKFNYDTATPI